MFQSPESLEESTLEGGYRESMSELFIRASTSRRRSRISSTGNERSRDFSESHRSESHFALRGTMKRRRDDDGYDTRWRGTHMRKNHFANNGTRAHAEKSPGCASPRLEAASAKKNRSVATVASCERFFTTRLRTMQVGLSPKNKLFNRGYIRARANVRWRLCLYVVRYKLL